MSSPGKKKPSLVSLANDLLFNGSTAISSPEMKRRKKNPTPNPSLPDDLLLGCIARLSRLYYPTLSLVSKRFRSLLVSPELYKARSLLSHTESCLYVCLRFYSKPYHRWFTLCRKSDRQTLTKDIKSSGYVLAAVPIPDFPDAEFSSLVVVGPNIYNIAGSLPSSSVSILDCRSHTWREGPSLRVKLFSASASVDDRKIYVAGRYKDGHSVEVLDTEAQIWDPLPSVPCSETEKPFFYGESSCIDGKFHLMADNEVVAYNSKESRWDFVEKGRRHFLFSDSYCQIEDVFYSIHNGAVSCYDPKVGMWRNLTGLVGLSKFPPRACVRLADYGGKMAVFWDEYCSFSGPYPFSEKKIWCAQIALERRKSCEIWGKVEWFDHVLTVRGECDLVKVLAPTL